MSNNNCFVILIGDDGVIVTHIVKKNIATKIFLPINNATESSELKKILSLNPTATIELLIDNSEQSYNQQQLPAVSALSINKLVKKRLYREFSKSDIKGAIPLGKSEEGRKDWIYMFASTPVNEHIKKWITLCLSLPNEFIGIYMLPIEVENFIKKIAPLPKKIKEKNKIKEDIQENEENEDSEKKLKKDDHWQFIIFHNKVSGFRQTVLKNQRIIFTRLINKGNDNLPAVIAGNIEQEIVNTLDYLKRLSLQDDDQIEIIVIVAQDLKSNLVEGETNKGKIQDRIIKVFTPFEIATKLQLEKNFSKQDKYNDLLISLFFIHSKPILRLQSQESEKVVLFQNIFNWSNLAIKALIAIIIITTTYSGHDLITLQQSIKNNTNQKELIEKKWKNISDTDNYSLSESDKISSSVAIYKKLYKKDRDPLDIIYRISNLQKNNGMLSSFSWRNHDKNILESTFNIDFYNTGSDIEMLYSNFEKFTTNIKMNFEEFTIEHTKLPKQINFNQQLKNIPVQVKLLESNKKK